jgi:hypothetical protein
VEHGEVRHPPFPEPVREHLRLIQQTFKDVKPMALDEWEFGFRHDSHPDQEIAIWLFMAEAYNRFTRGRTLHEDQKRDIFRVIRAFVNNGPGFVTKTVSPATLSRKRVKEMVESMRGLHCMYPDQLERVREAFGWKTTKAGELAACLTTTTPRTDDTMSIKVAELADLVGKGPEPHLDPEARQVLQEADVVLAFLGADDKPCIAFGRDAWQDAEEADPAKTPRVFAVRVEEGGDELEKLLGAIRAVRGRHDWPTGEADEK